MNDIPSFQQNSARTSTTTMKSCHRLLSRQNLLNGKTPLAKHVVPEFEVPYVVLRPAEKYLHYI
jgi:hypothetical protein